MKKPLLVVIKISLLIIGQMLLPPRSAAQDGVASNCTNLIINGDMEGTQGWNLTTGPIPGEYVSLSHNGSQGLQLGLASGQTLDSPAWSTAWQATVLPANSKAEFSFWYRTLADLEPGADRLYAGLLDRDGQIIQNLLNTRQATATWSLFQEEILVEAEQVLQVYFGLENDGLSGATRLLIDEVTLCVAPIENEDTVESPTSTTPLRSTLSDVAASASTISTLPAVEAVTPVPVYNPADLISFHQFGFAERVLQPTAPTTKYLFGLPADWQPTETTAVQLDLAVFDGTANDAITRNIQRVLGLFKVKFNGLLLNTITINTQGEYTLTIPIPTNALTSLRNDGQHELSLTLEAEVICDTENLVSVIVRDTSHLAVPHERVSPTMDLRFLPRPIYQGSFLTESAVIVVPNQPTASELQAALSVAAGFGQMTKQKLFLALRPASEVTPEIRNANHLIFVGAGSAFPSLADVSLPVSVDEASIGAIEINPDNGLVQMAVSPWNSSKVILFVSGQSGEGIIKAGQAISTGLIRVGTRADFAIVSQIQPNNFLSYAHQANRTFSDLGYTVKQLKSKGVNFANYQFYVPPGYIADVNAFLELTINHSSLLDYEQSGIVVRLNGQAIGSVRLNDELTQVGQIQLAIPRSAIRPGFNEIQLRANLIPVTDCYDPNTDGIWLTIWPESTLHLPLRLLQGEVRSIFALSDYPEPFIQDPILDSTAFILPPDDPYVWHIAAQLAIQLGDLSDIPLAHLVVSYGNEVTEPIREAHHLLIVGHPKTLPILNELREVMPAPFEAGQNIALEQTLRVLYRLEPDASVGYLQVFSAPWNRSRVILTVLGSTQEGLDWAASTLLTPQSRNQLESNLAVISNGQIVTGDMVPTANPQVEAPTAVLEASLPATSENPTTTPSGNTPLVPTDDKAPAAPNASFSPIAEQPIWLLPLLGGSIMLMVLIILIVIISTWRRSHSARREP